MVFILVIANKKVSHVTQALLVLPFFLLCNILHESNSVIQKSELQVKFSICVGLIIYLNK